MSLSPATNAVAPPPLPVKPFDDGKQAAAKVPSSKAGDKDGFSFWDLVDIVNPLQHIPIVSTLYREVTGDKINNFARIAGGGLFGGFIGAIAGGVDAIAVHETGHDMGQVALQAVGLDRGNKTVADENIPMIEVRPQRQAPQVAMKAEQIIWDKPIRDLSARSLPTPEPLQKLQDVATAHPSATIDKAQLPSAMLQALQKYQELRSANPDPSQAGLIVKAN